MFRSPLCRLLLVASLALAGATCAHAQQQTPPHAGPVPPIATPVPPSPPVVKAPVAPTVKSLDKKPDEKKSDPLK